MGKRRNKKLEMKTVFSLHIELKANWKQVLYNFITFPSGWYIQ